MRMMMFLLEEVRLIASLPITVNFSDIVRVMCVLFSIGVLVQRPLLHELDMSYILLIDRLSVTGSSCNRSIILLIYFAVYIS